MPISSTPGPALPKGLPEAGTCPTAPSPLQAPPCLVSLTFQVREQQFILPVRRGEGGGGLRWCSGEGTVPSRARTEALQRGDTVRSGLGCGGWVGFSRSGPWEDHAPTFQMTCLRLCPSGVLATPAWPLSEGSRDRVLVGTHPAEPSPTTPGWPQGEGHRRDLDRGSLSPEPNPGSTRDSQE